MMKNYYFLAVFLFISCLPKKIQKVTDKNLLQLEIKQLVVSPQYLFKIYDNEMTIFEKKYYTKKQKLLDKQKKVFSKKLSKDDISEIKITLSKLRKAKSEYINSVLGGVDWEISFTVNNNKKKIRLENTTTDEITKLFRQINSLIPAKKPHIIII